MRISSAFVFAITASLMLSAETPQQEDEAIRTSLCDIYLQPDEYDGSYVQVHGTIIGTRKADLWIDDFRPSPCPAFMKIRLVFPEDASPVPNFALQRDDASIAFEAAISERRSMIEGTFEGTFLSFISVQDGRRIRTNDSGTGDYDGQIILRHVSEIVTWPIYTR